MYNDFKMSTTPQDAIRKEKYEELKKAEKSLGELLLKNAGKEYAEYAKEAEDFLAHNYESIVNWIKSNYSNPNMIKFSKNVRYYHNDFTLKDFIVFESWMENIPNCRDFNRLRSFDCLNLVDDYPSQNLIAFLYFIGLALKFSYKNIGNIVTDHNYIYTISFEIPEYLQNSLAELKNLSTK